MALVSVATDNFNRTNGAVGSNWTQIPNSQGKPVISSNRISNNGAGTNYYEMCWTASGFNDDQYSRVTLPILASTSGDGGPLVRCSTTARTFYQLTAFFYSGTWNVILYEQVAGVGTELTDIVPVTLATGGTLELRVIGSHLYGYVNGALVVDVIDTQITSGYAGVNISDATLRLDDFDGGNITSDGVTGTGSSACSSTSSGAAVELLSGSGTSTVSSTSSGAAVELFAGTGTASMTTTSSGAGLEAFASSGSSAVSGTSSGAFVERFITSGSSVTNFASLGFAIEKFLATGTSAASSTSAGAFILQYAGTGASAASSTSAGVGSEVFLATGSSASSSTSAGVGLTGDVNTAIGMSTAASTSVGMGVVSYVGSGSSNASTGSIGAATMQYSGSGSSAATSTGVGAATLRYFGPGASTAASTTGGLAAETFVGSGASVASTTSSGSGIAYETGEVTGAGRSECSSTSSGIGQIVFTVASIVPTENSVTKILDTVIEDSRELNLSKIADYFLLMPPRDLSESKSLERTMIYVES